MNPLVSIIIVNYNTCDLTLQCLQSIYQCIHSYSFEVIVVDNASSDNSVGTIRNNFPQVKIISNPVNMGFGQANNLAMEIAEGKYFFLLNSDTIILNDIFAFFVPFMEDPQNKDVCAIGGILENEKGRPIHSGGNFPTLFQEIKESWRDILIQSYIIKFLRKIKHRFFPPPHVISSPSSIMEVDYITGADLFLRREIYESIGGFDPRFFLYYEETDWEFQMAKKGWKRLLLPGPRIIHLEGKSAHPKSMKSFTISKISCLKYFKKNLPLYKYILLKFAFFLFGGILLLVNSITHYFKPVEVLSYLVYILTEKYPRRIYENTFRSK